MSSSARSTCARICARGVRAARRPVTAALAVGLGLSGIVLAAPATAAGPPTLIDDFLTPGTVGVTATVTGSASVTEGSGSASTFGGTRGLTLTVTDPATTAGALTFSAPGTGGATITAPGPIGATVELDYPGGSGGGTDLTDAGAAAAIRTRVDAATPGSTLAVTVASNGGSNPCSTATKAIPAVSGGRSADVLIPFSTLAVGAGCSGLADLTNARDVTVVITLPGTGSAGAPALTLGRIDTVGVSWGTLPASYHATLASDDGAAHVITPGLQLGSTITAADDGNPGGTSSSADGVTIAPQSTWTAADGGAVDVTGQGTGCLSGWVDWNGNSSFAEPLDAVVSNHLVTLSGAAQEIDFAVPASFVLPTYPTPATVNARWRLFPTDGDGTCTTAESSLGSVEGGEVEDYAWALTAAPTAPTITSSPGNLIGAGPASTGSATNLTWTFSVPAGTTPSCELLVAGVPLGGFAPCTAAGSQTYPLSSLVVGLTDGAFALAVRDTETSTIARTSPTTTAAYTLDRVAPAAPTIKTAPSSPGNSRSPQWTITAETGSSVICTVTDGSTTIVQTTCVNAMPAAPTTATVVVNLATQVDGTYTLALTAADAAGNTSGPTSSSYALDTTAPAAPAITAPLPTTPSNNLSPTWTFDLPAGAVSETCKVVAGTDPTAAALPGNGPSSCAGQFVADLTGVPDGLVSFVVAAQDAAGNVSSAARHTIRLDTHAAAPAIATGPKPSDNVTSVGWTFSGETGAVFTCSLVRGATPIAGPAPCTTSTSQAYDLSSQPDGTYTFSVSQVDRAGNQSPPATTSYVLDRVAPTITGVTPPASPSAVSNPAWTLTSNDPQTVWSCTLSGPGGYTSTPASCGTGTSTTVSFALGMQLDGTYTLSFSAKDAVGNQSTGTPSTFVLQRIAGAPVITATPADPGRATTLTWTFTVPAGDTAECKLDYAGTIVQDWTTCSGSFSRDVSALSDGAFTFSTRATDPLDSVSPDVTSTVVLDRVAPAAPLITGPATPGHTLTPLWTFAAEPGSRTTCAVLAGSSVLTPWGTCAGQVIQDLSGQPDGTYTLQVQATDAAGNVGAIAASAYRLDTVPDVPVITSHPASPGSTRSPTWGFTTEPGASVQCRLVSGSQIVYDLATCAGTKAYSLAGRADGTYTIGVRDTDPAGNVSQEVTSPFTLDTTAPAPPGLDGPLGPSRATTATWTVTADATAITRCRLTTPTGLVKTDWTACAGSWTQQLTGGPDGSWVVQAQSVDQAGNTSATATLLYALDTTPPPFPTITGRPAADPGNDVHPTWTFNVEPGSVALCDLAWGDVQVASVSPCTSPATFDLTSFPDGTYNLSVTPVDSAGNTGPAAADSYRLQRKATAGGGGDGNGNGDGDGAGNGAGPGGGITTHDGGGTGSPGGGTTIGPASGPGAPVIVPHGGTSGGKVPDGTPRTVHPATTPTGTDPAATIPKSQRKPDDSSFGSTVQNILKEAPNRAAIPIALLLIVLLFLLVQDRLDRGDPKLAQAPVHGDDDLEFR